MCEAFNKLEQEKTKIEKDIAKATTESDKLRAEIQELEAKLPRRATSEASFVRAIEEIEAVDAKLQLKTNFIKVREANLATCDIELEAILDTKKQEDMMDVINALEANVDKFIKQLKRPSETFNEIELLVISLFNSGPKAKAWPDEVFKYKKPHELTRHFLMCSIAHAFQFSSREKLEVPNKTNAEKGTNFDQAFKDFAYVRDLWKHPERFIEIAPEDIEWEAATEADFNDADEDEVIEDNAND